MSYFTKNKEIIQNRNIKLDALFDDEIPLDDKIYSAVAKDGTPIMIIEHNNSIYRMNSLYNPIQETKFWVSQYDFSKENIVISLFGLGNGQFVRSIIDEMKEDAHLIIVEPSKEIFLSAIHEYDMSDILLRKNVFITVMGVNDEFWSYLLNATIKWENVYNQIVCTHPYYSRLFQNELRIFNERISRNYESVSIDRNTEAHFGPKYVKAMIDCLHSYPKINSMIDCKNIVPSDIPGIIIAAGPSLDKNIEELRSAKGKAVLFATDRALPALLERCIIPDFVVTVDPDKPDACFADEKSRTIPLICTAHSKLGVISNHESRIFLISCYDYINNLANKLGSSIPYIDTGASVATTAFSICLYLGLKNIIFVGQDLAFKGSVTHAGGEEEKVYLDDEIYVEGIDGKIVKTRFDWERFRLWYEDRIKYLPEDVKVIDATEGGALIHGTKVMTLHDVVERYCNQQFDVAKEIENIPYLCTNEKLSIIKDYVSCGLNECNSLVEIARNINNLCKSTLTKIKRKQINFKKFETDHKKIKKTNESLQKLTIFQLIDLSVFKTTVEKHKEVNTKLKTEVDVYHQIFTIYQEIYDQMLQLVSDMKENFEKQLDILNKLS